jgi:hypothetical protein
MGTIVPWEHKYRDLVLQVEGWAQGCLTLHCKKNYCFKIQRSEKWINKIWQNLLGRPWLKKCYFASDDDDIHISETYSHFP